ncbi:MAG: molybdenum cofactor guanylyltransferase [Candidatus Bathyarchaeota archaeon]|nr:molybdenum cofactor guanylyltransferase [Candidatus Bathyarchaeota archaeon]
MPKRAAIVLAGGSARRFQIPNQPWQDKALAEIDGTPLLVHVIKNLRDIVDEVAVCTNTKDRQTTYAKTLETYGVDNVEFVLDPQNSPVKGPLLAIKSGLDAVSADYCLTVSVDMPCLKPTVADFMFNIAAGFDVAVPMWPDGKLETLLAVLKRETCLEITETLLALKQSRADTIFRGARSLLLVSPLEEIIKLDPDLKSFININTKDDLNNLPKRSTQGAIKGRQELEWAFSLSSLQVLRGGLDAVNKGSYSQAVQAFSRCTTELKKTSFWAGVSNQQLGETKLAEAGLNSSTKDLVLAKMHAKECFILAGKNFDAEAKLYEEKKCKALADRALSDKKTCETKAEKVGR